MTDTELEVARVVRSHGLQGEVVVELITEREERMAPGARLHAEVSGDRQVLVIRRARRQRPATARRPARWIAQFEGYERREAAERLRGLSLRAEALDDPDELWAHELIGSEVRLLATGEVVGVCADVIPNPAADLLELDTGALVPVVFVVEHAPGRVMIDPPPGLLEL
jgi:16S rRNA processing protein RimM